MNLLDVNNIVVKFKTKQGIVHAVNDVSLSLKEGEVLAIVGESGCGKSALCRAIMGLLPANSQVEGSVMVDDNNILFMNDKEKDKLRGSFFSMIFQDPLTALDPTMTIGNQIAEAILTHNPKMKKEDVEEKVYELLELVGISEPKIRAKQYSYNFSGGMRQRSVLAIALANHPRILLADEPTTALDVTIQSQILKLLSDIQKKMSMATIFISHDLRVVRQVADRIAVMYAGKIVEIGKAEEIFEDPKHPYTWGLLKALPESSYGKEELYTIPGTPPNLYQIPKGDAFAPRNEYALAIDYEEEPELFDITDTHKAATWLVSPNAPHIEFDNPIYSQISGLQKEKRKETRNVVKVDHLTKNFYLPRKVTIEAVKDVSFTIQEGEIYGLVGESGSGKSTIARCLTGIYKDYTGEIYYEDIPLHDKAMRNKNAKRLQMERQMIFQDSTSSLNQRMRVKDIVMEPQRIHHIRSQYGSKEKDAKHLLSIVGLDDRSLDKLPGELSGGQRQRVAIARAIGINPKLLVADEPIAALDVSIQAQIINLFKQLQRERKYSILFIAHDLSMVSFICDRVGVMKDGELVEEGRTSDVFLRPKHPYTKELIKAIPRIDRKEYS